MFKIKRVNINNSRKLLMKLSNHMTAHESQLVTSKQQNKIHS